MKENLGAATMLLAPILRGFNISLKPNPEPGLERLLYIYPSLDVLSRRKIRQAFQILGFEDISSTLDPKIEAEKIQDLEVNSGEFACPETAALMCSPCRLKGCRYFLDFVPSFNCLLIAGKSESMEMPRIGEILNRHPNDISEVRLRAIRKMRADAIDVAKQQHEIQAEFVFLRNSRVCGSCEREIAGDAFYSESGISFCSGECISATPPANAILESRFGIPLPKLLKWVKARFRDVEAASHSLGFSSSVLKAAFGERFSTV
jgi:hypothetical protein